MKRLFRKQMIGFILGHILLITTGIQLDPMTMILWVGGPILVLWISYMLGADILIRYQKGKLNRLEIILGKAYLIYFIIADVVVNYTAVAYLFMEVADNDRKTVTARLKYYLKTQGTPPTWRWKLSLFMCKYMLEPQLPGHCALYKYGKGK